MTTVTKQPVLWSWATLCSGMGLSPRQLHYLRQRSDRPAPVKQENGQDLFDADQLVEWVNRVRDRGGLAVEARTVG